MSLRSLLARRFVRGVPFQVSCLLGGHRWFVGICVQGAYSCSTFFGVPAIHAPGSLGNEFEWGFFEMVGGLVAPPTRCSGKVLSHFKNIEASLTQNVPPPPKKKKKKKKKKHRKRHRIDFLQGGFRRASTSRLGLFISPVVGTYLPSHFPQLSDRQVVTGASEKEVALKARTGSEPQ